MKAWLASIIRQAVTGSPTLDGLCPLKRRYLGLAAELDASGLAALAALAGVFADQISLELSCGSQDGSEKLSLRAGGVPQRVSERAEGCTSLADALNQLKRLPSRATQAIELGDHDNITRAYRSHKLGQTRRTPRSQPAPLTCRASPFRRRFLVTKEECKARPISLEPRKGTGLMTRFVLLAIGVFALFVITYFSAGLFLDAQQPQQELKRDLGPQNVDQRP